MRRISALFLTTAALLLTQTDRGNITGNVKDPTGAIIAGAVITATHLATGATTTVTSTTGGAYNMPNLSPGEYRLEVTAPGFKRVVHDNIILTASGTNRLDALLQAGQVTETVEVTSVVPQSQVENAKTRTSVQNKMVDGLPLVVGGA